MAISRDGDHFAMQVDERWYLEQYQDVAESVRKGVVGSAEQHFA